MTRKLSEHDITNNKLSRVVEGMAVYDRDGDHIGTVQYVFLGAVTEEADEHGLGPATAPPQASDSPLLEGFARLFAPTTMPDILQQRLRRRGFISIDSRGLFAADRYAMPEQIADVSADRVTLSVTRDALIER